MLCKQYKTPTIYWLVVVVVVVGDFLEAVQLIGQRRGGGLAGLHNGTSAGRGTGRQHGRGRAGRAQRQELPPVEINFLGRDFMRLWRRGFEPVRFHAILHQYWIIQVELYKIGAEDVLQAD